MSEEEDYLSDAFLLKAETASTSSSLSYSERRRKAQRDAETKDLQNRKKKQRQLELDARQEALSKSLFERAKEEEESGAKPGNKALSMMMKMGFKPGQSLGKTDDVVEEPASSSTTTDPATATRSSTTAPHLIEPLPIKMWAGRSVVEFLQYCTIN